MLRKIAAGALILLLAIEPVAALRFPWQHYRRHIAHAPRRESPPRSPPIECVDILDAIRTLTTDRLRRSIKSIPRERLEQIVICYAGR